VLYREIDPPSALRGQVTCIWILDHAAEADAPPEKILPDGRAELILNLGAPYRRIDEGEAQHQPRSFVVGQIRRYLEVVPTGHVSMIGVRFQPTALHRIIGNSMSELTDCSVPLADLGVPELLELEERLHDAPDWPARVSLVAEQLLRLIPTSIGHMGEALSLIRGTHGRLDLGRVSRMIGVSTRTLDRRFSTEVGLTPKLYSRQIRLQRVFELLSATPRPALSEIALASGCFDQAHLNREFRTFAGESPTEFLRSRHELSDHLTGLACDQRLNQGMG
jgi:AraC-like DNA-binding protein